MQMSHVETLLSIQQELPALKSSRVLRTHQTLLCRGRVRPKLSDCSVWRPACVIIMRVEHASDVPAHCIS